MSKFNIGDRVVWQYRHHFNRHSSALRSKTGVIKSAHKESDIYTGLYSVLFDGNKTVSRYIPGSELSGLTNTPPELNIKRS